MLIIRICPQGIALRHRRGKLHHFDNSSGPAITIVLILDEHRTIAFIEGIAFGILKFHRDQADARPPLTSSVSRSM